MNVRQGFCDRQRSLGAHRSRVPNRPKWIGHDVIVRLVNGVFPSSDSFGSGNKDQKPQKLVKDDDQLDCSSTQKELFVYLVICGNVSFPSQC